MLLHRLFESVSHFKALTAFGAMILVQRHVANLALLEQMFGEDYALSGDCCSATELQELLPDGT